MHEGVQSCIKLHSRAEPMAELTRESASCLFGDILPAASFLSKETKGGRPPATPLRNQWGGGDKTKPSERPQKFQKQQKGKHQSDAG